MQSEQEHLNQSQKILNAAFVCLSTRGYANVSLRNIADEAGVVLSQLHYYYKNKDGLFSEVLKTLMKRYLQDIEEVLEKGKSAKEKISFLIVYFNENAKNNPQLLKLLYDFTGMALWSSLFSDLLKNSFQKLTDLIEKHIFTDLAANPKLKSYSPAALSRMLFGAMYGTAVQISLDPDSDANLNSLNAIQAIFE